MATIGNLQSIHGFKQHLASMDDTQLIAQDLTQQGAIHAVATLITWGPNVANAHKMLDELRRNAQLIREEAARRGREALFPVDQVEGQH